jgi:glutamate carboxypeptidase
VVPDFAEAIVDLRFWRNEEAQAVHDRLTFMANNPFLAGCRVEVARQSFKPAMRPSGYTEALMALVEAAGREEESLSPGWRPVAAPMPISPRRPGCRPSMASAPWGAFHSEAEFLLLDSIEPRIRLLKRVLGKLAN